MKTFIIILTLCFTMSCSTVSKLEELPIVQISKDSVYLVQIIGVQDDGTEQLMGNGSAFAISNTLLVTNHHVASAGEILRIVTYEGEVFSQVEVIKTDEENDVAILESALRLPNYLPIHKGVQPSYLTKVFISGYPLGDRLMITQGTYQQESGTMPKYIRVSAPSAPGNSGGPALIFSKRTQRFEVIGIMTAHAGSANLRLTSFSLLIPISKVKELLKT